MATVPINVRIAQLPNQIPPQSAPVLMDGGGGAQVFETNWWLFLYNIASQVLTLSGTGVQLPDSVSIALEESEVFDTDNADLPRRIANALLFDPVPVDSGPTQRDVVNAVLFDPLPIDASPTQRDVANALMLAADSLLPDPAPRAQPVAVVTVGASPFTFTAPANGTVAISIGTVSAVTLIRQGVSVATGVTDGLIPVSRLDQVQITYAVAPTVAFLPS